MMGQRAFLFDMRLCTGCKTCVVACGDAHGKRCDAGFRTVREHVAGDTLQSCDGEFESSCRFYYTSSTCGHCDRPACVAACSHGACTKDSGTGIVSIDARACAGCGSCARACPHHAVHLDAQDGFARKCDGCHDLVAQGEEPVCVEACPTRALAFGFAESVPAGYCRLTGVDSALDSGTMPNLFVFPCRDMRLENSL